MLTFGLGWAAMDSVETSQQKTSRLLSDVVVGWGEKAGHQLMSWPVLHTYCLSCRSAVLLRCLGEEVPGLGLVQEVVVGWWRWWWG